MKRPRRKTQNLKTSGYGGEGELVDTPSWPSHLLNLLKTIYLFIWLPWVLVALKWQAHSFHFYGNVCQIPSLNNRGLPVILFRQDGNP